MSLVSSAGNSGDVISWIFSADDCVLDAEPCRASEPPGAAIRQCLDGFFLELEDDNICRPCGAIAGCPDGNVHCTNGLDTVCGDCDSGFSSTGGHNFYSCEYVSIWPQPVP